MDPKDLLDKALTWLRDHQKSVRFWLLTVTLAALALSLIRVEWSSASGMSVSLGPTSFTIAVVVLILSPLVIAALLLSGGRIKAAGVELTVESLLTKLVVSDETRQELMGILSAEAARAADESDSEAAELGRRVQHALEDVAFESGVAPRTEKELLELAEEYKQLREKMPKGTARTRQMTSIQTRMRGAARGQEPTEAKVESWLDSSDQGLRLLGLTFAREQAKASFIDGVLDKIANSAAAFEQYQALLAMERLVPELGPAKTKKLRLVLDKQREPGGYLWDNQDRRAISDRILRRLS
jgi:hypothetical protein